MEFKCSRFKVQCRANLELGTLNFELFCFRVGAVDDAEDLVFAHDEVFFTVELDLGAAVFAEKDTIARFYIKRLASAVFLILAFADGDDLAFLRLFLCGVGYKKPTGGLVYIVLDAANDHKIVERFDFC